MDSVGYESFIVCQEVLKLCISDTHTREKMLQAGKETEEYLQHFLHCHDDIHDRSNLEKVGFGVSHSSRVQDIMTGRS